MMGRSALVALVLAALVSGVALAAVPPERTLFSESFESYQTDGCPPGWLPLEGNWFLAQRASRILRQGNEDLTSDSWALALWRNYTLTTKFLAEEGEGTWGVGLLAYANYEGHAYRLRASDGKLHLERVAGGNVRSLGSAEVRVSRGKWYSLRLTLTGEDNATLLQAKLWAGDQDEPKDSTLKVRDDQSPLPGGSIGLWTGNCAARFASVAARRTEADKSTEALFASDFSEVDLGHLPAFWVTRGGLWVRDTQDKSAVLRQMIPLSGPAYEDSAVAVLDWSGYAVSARAIAHPGPGKWGVGVVGYYGQDGANYRLRGLDNKIYLVKQVPGGRVQTLASAPADFKRGRWYNLKLALDNFTGYTRLMGKFWNDEAEEPDNWLLMAADQDHPLTGGAPGLWSFGGAADFDNFLVRTTPLSSLNASFTPAR